jgi:hypothetical protein
MEKFRQLLHLVGYEKVQDLEHRRKFVQAVRDFSAMAGETELARACSLELEDLVQIGDFLAFCAAVEAHLRNHYSMSPEQARRIVDKESEWIVDLSIQAA